MRDGDIYRWQWIDDKRDRHCCSPFAIAHKGELLDMYWMHGLAMLFVDQYTKHLKPEDVALEFLANVEDIEPVSSHDFHNYRPEDIIDLRHSNNSGAANIYRRKGSRPDPATIRANLVAKIADAEHSEES